MLFGANIRRYSLKAWCHLAEVSLAVAAAVREGEGDCDRTDRGAATTATRLAVLHREAFTPGFQRLAYSGILPGSLGWGAATRGRP